MLPSEISELVKLTVPNFPFTLCTGEPGVSISTQSEILFEKSIPKINVLLKSVLTATVPLIEVAPIFNMSVALFAIETEVKENAGNKKLGILELPSNPGTPLGVFIELLSTLLFKAFAVKKEMGLLMSDVLSTLAKFSVVLSITTAPVSPFTELTGLVNKTGLLIKSL